MPTLRVSGLLPAIIVPFRPDYSIDEEALTRFVHWILSKPGIGGIVCNGHAGEVSSLSRKERKQVTRAVVRAVAGKVPVVCGIHCEGTFEAVEHAKDAREAGADAVLVLPPHLWLISKEPGAAEAFFQAVANECGLPMIVFQYAQKWGQACYDGHTLLRLTEIPQVIAVKEAIWEMSRYEDEYRLLKQRAPHVAVLSANDEHLFASYCIGADGSLVGFASLAPDLISQMLQAAQRGDLPGARSLNDRLYPLTQAIYKTPPGIRMHSRIKAGLHMMGMIPGPTVRPPLLPLSTEERVALRGALVEAGLIVSNGMRDGDDGTIGCP